MSYPCLVGSADFHATDAVARHVETALQQEVGSILGMSSKNVVRVIQPRPLECFDEARLNVEHWFNGIVVESDGLLPSKPDPEKPKFPIRLPVLMETEEIQLRRIMICHDLALGDEADVLAQAVCEKVKEVMVQHPSVRVTEEPYVHVLDPTKDVDPDRCIPAAFLS